MDLKRLFEWWNLIYVVPFFAGVVFLLIQTIGLGSDFSQDHDVDHDLDHDMDHDADHDAEHDGSAQQAASNVGMFWKVATLLGIGYVPVSIVVMTFCFVWSFTGYFANMLLQPILRTPWLFVPVSLPSALIVSLLVTGIVSRLVAKVMPKISTHYNKEEELLGKIGEALYSIDPTSGTMRVQDDFGRLQQYPAFTGAQEKIPGGAKVLLVGFDREKGAFEVTSVEKTL
jgi:membrane protein implicated in regulation of membrane protease activity